jgi:predicted component of type VI protein secretion system
MTPINFLPAKGLFFSEQPPQQKSPTVLRRAIIQSDQNNFPEILRPFQSGGSIPQNWE